MGYRVVTKRFLNEAKTICLFEIEAPLIARHAMAGQFVIFRLDEQGERVPVSVAGYDREKGTQYYETLRAYLLNERDIPRTAQALIIHRTTLLYRLRKLQAVAPIDLDDPGRRLQLLISLWILDHQG